MPRPIPRSRNVTTWIVLLTMLPVLAMAQPDDEGIAVGSEGRRAAYIRLRNAKLLERTLLAGPAILQQVAARPISYRVQIIFTQVQRMAKGRVLLRHHTYGLDTTQYFFTASLVKLPTAALTLAFLRERGIPVTAKLELGAASACQAADAQAYQPLSIEELIYRSFVVSDNAAYNRLFEMLGPAYLNHELHRRGYGSVRIRHRYNSACWNDPTGGLNPLGLVVPTARGDSTCYAVGPRMETFAPHANLQGLQFNGGNYAYANFINLVDLHRMLLATMVPEALPPDQRWGLTAGDYHVLRKSLRALPTDAAEPWFDTTFYHAARMKYLVAGAQPDSLARLEADSVFIFNKVGLANGFMTDCAYVIDAARGHEFALSAVVYVNPDNLTGDVAFAYDTVGYDFFGSLGRALLASERARRVSFRPRYDELSELLVPHVRR